LIQTSFTCKQNSQFQSWIDQVRRLDCKHVLLRHVFSLLHVVETLCLDRCPRWRCNHSLYSAGVNFTGTRWRNPVCVYLDQPDTVITVPERHVKPDLRSVLHPDLHCWSMRAHTYRCIHTHVVKQIRLHTHFLRGLAFGQMSAELHVINYEQRERERDIYVSKPAVKPLVSSFPFNVKRPPQRKASTISTLLCFKGPTGFL